MYYSGLPEIHKNYNVCHNIANKYLSQFDKRDLFDILHQQYNQTIVEDTKQQSHFSDIGKYTQIAMYSQSTLDSSNISDYYIQMQRPQQPSHPFQNIMTEEHRGYMPLCQYLLRRLLRWVDREPSIKGAFQLNLERPQQSQILFHTQAAYFSMAEEHRGHMPLCQYVLRRLLRWVDREPSIQGAFQLNLESRQQAQNTQVRNLSDYKVKYSPEPLSPQGNRFIATYVNTKRKKNQEVSRQDSPQSIRPCNGNEEIDFQLRNNHQNSREEILEQHENSRDQQFCSLRFSDNEQEPIMSPPRNFKQKSPKYSLKQHSRKIQFQIKADLENYQSQLLESPKNQVRQPTFKFYRPHS